MKLVYIEIDGQPRALCLSNRVLSACTDRYGGVDAISDMFAAADQVKAVEETCWLIAQLMAAGEKYARMHGIDVAPALSMDELLDVTSPADFAQMQVKFRETIAGTGTASVEVEPPKNAEATLED